MLHSIYQKIWKIQRWPQDWKRSVFTPILKKGNAKECSNYHTIALISHASKDSESRSVMSNSLQPHGQNSPSNSPGQNTGVSSSSLLQGIFPTQGLNPGIPHCRQILYQLRLQGSPRILEWVAFPFSSRSSQPRNQTVVSCIAGRFFTN